MLTTAFNSHYPPKGRPPPDLVPYQGFIQPYIVLMSALSAEGVPLGGVPL